MRIDVTLPSVLFLISVAALLLHIKYEKKVRFLLGEKKLQIRDAVIMVTVMGAMVTVVAFIPQQAIAILFLFSYSVVLFLFTYVMAPKWYLAVLTPLLFVVLYIYCWNTHLSNLFAVIFAVSISLFLGSSFTWKSVAAFVPLLTLMDVVQVLGTGFMGTAAEKIQVLLLPAMIDLPTFPSGGQGILGLGDIFLAGLLAIQSTHKHGRKFGLSSVIAMTAVFSLTWIIQINSPIRYLPATVPIAGGWLIALGIKRLLRSKGTPVFHQRQLTAATP